jgi:hypothetical protein
MREMRVQSDDLSAEALAKAEAIHLISLRFLVFNGGD